MAESSNEALRDREQCFQALGSQFRMDDTPPQLVQVRYIWLQGLVHQARLVCALRNHEA